MADLAEKQKILVLGGPTASGKTSLSVWLAQQLKAEIISADSMQIYRGLDVGTAKVTQEEKQGVPHYLVDICDPEKLFSVAEYVSLAKQSIEQIAKNGNLPLLVGGTGLYISSLIRGMEFAPQAEHTELRLNLQQRLKDEGEEALYQELCQKDPPAAEKIHPHNHVRLLRALAACELSGGRFSDVKAAAIPQESPYEAKVMCIGFDDRQVLYSRIDQRIDMMVDAGLLKEAKQVYDNRTQWPTAAQAIGYKELFGYFEGCQSLEECVQQLKQASRRYAKRQLTWFRHMEGVLWLDGSSPNLKEQALSVALDFLNNKK